MLFFPYWQSPQEEPTPEERLIDEAASRVRARAHHAVEGRAERFQQLAAEFAHLGSVADELLNAALQDVALTPAYFEAVTRLGMQPPEPPKPTHEPTVIIGTVARTEGDRDEETDDEPSFERRE